MTHTQLTFIKKYVHQWGILPYIYIHSSLFTLLDVHSYRRSPIWDTQPYQRSPIWDVNPLYGCSPIWDIHPNGIFIHIVNSLIWDAHHIVRFRKLHRIGGAPPKTFPNVKYDAHGNRKCFDSPIRKWGLVQILHVNSSRGLTLCSLTVFCFLQMALHIQN